MEPIRVYSQMMIDLGGTARLLVTECTDGWNIEIVNPKDVRIGTGSRDGIHFRYVTELMSHPRDSKPGIA